ncbi:hypothetical protein HBH98_097570 [Parastagonospora nodorum]|nr:hypothetical protein HBH42_125280 [Parastagonospora nodorum]KAH4346746.1 hypothetical protein HBH98_097570 [Parastagonospora nodorum]KAH4382069.1 hypothetical protein HBH97_080680 [Parastagonospora nodorum]KAH4398510.1 hypothetical protein HBH99_110500 [Parastagonospora nodorum]
MIENRPTGDAEAVGAINKGLWLQCQGLADEAGLTRLAVVGRGKCRKRQAQTWDGLDWRRSWRCRSNAQAIEGIEGIEGIKNQVQASWILRQALRGGERRDWRARWD